VQGSYARGSIRKFSAEGNVRKREVVKHQFKETNKQKKTITQRSRQMKTLWQTPGGEVLNASSPGGRDIRRKESRKKGGETQGLACDRHWDPKKVKKRVKTKGKKEGRRSRSGAPGKCRETGGGVFKKETGLLQGEAASHMAQEPASSPICEVKCCETESAPEGIHTGKRKKPR